MLSIKAIIVTSKSYIYCYLTDTWPFSQFLSSGARLDLLTWLFILSSKIFDLGVFHAVIFLHVDQFRICLEGMIVTNEYNERFFKTFRCTHLKEGIHHKFDKLVDRNFVPWLFASIVSDISAHCFKYLQTKIISKNIKSRNLIFDTWRYWRNETDDEILPVFAH